MTERAVDGPELFRPGESTPMGAVTSIRFAWLDCIPSPQFDCQATIIPSDEELDVDHVIESCRHNDSVLQGLEGDPDLEYFCVRFDGRLIEVYTEQALRNSF